MTDAEAIAIVAKILELAPSFGKVGNLKPEIHVRLNPLRVRIGELFLSAPKAQAIANGSLRVEARALGWVLTGEMPYEPRARRKPPKIQSLVKRRAEYLREVGRA
jgi:hypothetical protein